MAEMILIWLLSLKVRDTSLPTQTSRGRASPNSRQQEAPIYLNVQTSSPFDLKLEIFRKMEGEPGEASFEGLMEAGHDVSAVDDHFDPNTITHAMITPDGTTVPITLNPETGQFMTPDGQAVQVQMQSDETEYMDDSESVLPDPQDVEGVQGMDHGHETSSFQVMSAADAVQQQGPPQTVMVKTEENYPMQIDQSSVQVSDGNIQVLSSDGSMV